MKKRFALLSVGMLLLTAASSPHAAIAQDNSSTHPADIGAPVRSMVELGSVYANIYDITITVLEVVRGEKAMTRLREADPKNPAAPEGMEYVLARVRFEFKGRAVTDRLPFDLGNAPLQWVALSSDLMEYPRASVTVPKPALAGQVKPGDTVEGWVAFAVDRKESKPVMVFDPDVGGATGRGRTLFFKLY